MFFFFEIFKKKRILCTDLNRGRQKNWTKSWQITYPVLLKALLYIYFVEERGSSTQYTYLGGQCFKQYFC